MCAAFLVLERDASKINKADITYRNLGPNSNSALRYMIQSVEYLAILANKNGWYTIPTSMQYYGYWTLLPGIETPRPPPPHRRVRPSDSTMSPLTKRRARPENMVYAE